MEASSIRTTRPTSYSIFGRPVGYQPSTEGGGGGTSCAYPMDATNEQVQAWGFYGRPAMSESDQKATFAVDMTTGATRYYAATPVGFYDGTSSGFTLPAGKSALQIKFQIPTFAGFSNNNAMIGRARIGKCADTDSAFEARMYCRTDGTHRFEIGTNFNSNLYTEVVYDNSSGELSLTLEFDKEAGTIAVRKNGTLLTLNGSNTYDTTSEQCFVAYLEHWNAAYLRAEDAAKFLSIQYISNGSDITGTVSSSMKDICGNAL